LSTLWGAYHVEKASALFDSATFQNRRWTLHEFLPPGLLPLAFSLKSKKGAGLFSPVKADGSTPKMQALRLAPFFIFLPAGLSLT